MQFEWREFNGKEWCRINANTEIEHIDWDEVERLAERHRAGIERNDNTAIGSLAIALREYILRAPNIPIKSKD